MRAIKADWWGNFHRDAWQRDNPFHCEDEYFLDLSDGSLVWVPDELGIGGGSLSEKEIRELEAEVLSAPDRYVRVPPLDHGEHHRVFQGFLKTVPEEVRELGNPVSIGGFLKDMDFHFPDHEWRRAWEDFRNKVLMELAAIWYRKKGIEIEWR